ncbi:MAG: TonB-dependent receptor [Porphyromonas sp.]|nr:TonB-dependent receptor [Porphyromonas sp.]
MMRLSLLLIVTLGACGLGLHAQQEADLDELVVVGTRPGERTPITKQKLDIKQVQQRTTAWDVPSMLQGTPSLIVTNESGVFGGYTYFSVRGVDPTRVNITVNGVPVNDSESQTVFWANMPDFGSRLQDIVIVRGAGSSTFGAGAFGATMDMRLSNPSSKAGGEISVFGGSYGLQRQMVSYNTGRLRSGWNLSGSLSRTKSDGYVDRSGGKGFAYLLHADYLGDNYSLQLIHNSGKQQTGIAWNGITEAEEKAYGRTFNSAGLMNPGETDPAKFEYFDNNDNYDQSHTYAIFRHYPSADFQYEMTLHYTRGEGFTREYRTGRSYREYGLVSASDKTKGALIREKYLDNHFFGGIANLSWTRENSRISGGFSLNRYLGDHFGELPYVADPTIKYTPQQEYYRNSSSRTDGAIYLKGELDLSSTLMLYSDLMYRHVRAKMEGPSDKWNGHTKSLDVLDYDLKYNFFLPKIGLTWNPNRRSQLYLSAAMAGKEPNRKNYTESKRYDKEGNQIMPNPEYLWDFELGGNWRGTDVSLFANAYYMHYKDQLVPNGRYSDVGEALLINVPKSYRAGLELGAEWRIVPQLRLSANGTLSRNRIKDYHFIEANSETWEEREFVFDNTPIAKSPKLIFNHALTWQPVSAFSIALSGNYVGKQYLDNSGLEGRSLPSYYTGQLMANYQHGFRNGQLLSLQLQVLNLYNATYSTNGWVYGYLTEVDGKEQHDQEMGLFPAAPIHFVVGATLSF